MLNGQRNAVYHIPQLHRQCFFVQIQTALRIFLSLIEVVFKLLSQHDSLFALQFMFFDAENWHIKLVN